MLYAHMTYFGLNKQAKISQVIKKKGNEKFLKIFPTRKYKISCVIHINNLLT